MTLITTNGSLNLSIPRILHRVLEKPNCMFPATEYASLLALMDVTQDEISIVEKQLEIYKAIK